MSNPLLLKLEDKINHALEVIELLRFQLSEAEEKIQTLKIENAELQDRQLQWEQSLSSLLKKLSNADLSVHAEKIELEADIEGYETTEEAVY